jgi:hypothetical protein
VQLSETLFEAALGVSAPWYVAGADFDAAGMALSIRVDFKAGRCFAPACAEGEQPVHDTRTKRHRHLTFFQHDCFLEVHSPRVKLPDGGDR